MILAFYQSAIEFKFVFMMCTCIVKWFRVFVPCDLFIIYLTLRISDFFLYGLFFSPLILFCDFFIWIPKKQMWPDLTSDLCDKWQVFIPGVTRQEICISSDQGKKMTIAAIFLFYTVEQLHCLHTGLDPARHQGRK